MMDKLLEQVIGIAQQAGDAIMEVYHSDEHGVETKEDDSPLTIADKAANDIIVRELEKISKLPIISEENEQREGADTFWLVDPLDGTKEFIKKNGEFTVNIGLIHNKKPILGVVYAPDKGVTYVGSEAGAFKYEAGQETKITAHHDEAMPTIVASRSHRDERVDALLENIGEHKIVSMGSSFKLCLVADGTAMLYPRLAPTYLWDTAAADAVVRAAGGRVQNLAGEDLTYDPAKDMKNPFFVVSTKNCIDWQRYLG